ncbi:hypothetical protein PINS_up023531 [Pythium insidiosum]|nr:hypothetical protein PINS_up023531 [Pythium insidiosum]
MSGARDIRSFFTSNGPSPKRRRTAAGAVATAAETDAAEISTKATDAEQSEAAVEAAAESTDASADAPASAEGAAKPEKELVKEPLPHKFSNLHHNVPFLMHESWHAQLADEFKRPYFKSLVQFLTTEENKKKTLYPSPENVFAALRDCAFDSLKVVILGQDPYPRPESSARAVVLGAPWHPAAAESGQHLQGSHVRRRHLQAHARLSVVLEQAGRAHAQHRADSASRRAKLAQGTGMGEAHRRRHHAHQQACGERGLPSVGQASADQGCNHQQQQAPHHQVVASVTSRSDQDERAIYRLQVLLPSQCISREARQGPD